MNVRQKLKINSIGSTVALFVVLAVIAVSAYRVNRALEAADISDAIMKASYERLMLRTDNHRTLSARTKEQLVTKHREVGRLLKKAKGVFWSPEDRKTIDELLAVHEATGNLSRAIRGSREMRGPDVGPDAFSREYEDRLTRQLDMKVYETIQLDSQLQKSGMEAVASSLKLAGGGIVLVLLLVSAATLTNSWAMARSVTDRIGRLRDGAGRIGDGNLEHWIALPGNDEFSELADSFNDMASKLLDSYLKLEKEIEEHRRDEEALRRHGAMLTGINRVLGFSLVGYTEEQLCVACLDVVEGITESGVSFIGEIGDDGFLHDLAISNPGWDTCKMYDQSGHRKPPGNFSIHGIYGRVLLDGKGLIANAPGSHPDSIGLPEGHPPLYNFLGVPLKRKGRTAGMIAVGNRAGGYRNKDLQELEAIAPAIIQAIDRKRAEEALRESEERLRLLGDNLPESAVYQYVHEPDGRVRFLYYSAGIERLNGVTVADVLRDPGSLHRQIPPEYLERLVEAEEVSKRELSDFDMEVPMQRPDGRIRWMHLHSRPRRLSDGRTAWDGVQIDVTARKQSEEALRRSEEEIKKSLHEKEVLLKEIHHRVKNNLQVISSLVSLQANGIKDENVKEVLRDVTFRVRSMALVHEKLYQSRDFARIDFREYTRSLLHFLWRSHGAAASPIRLTFDLQMVELPVDTAVPCGLILNELAGNALKHAFKDRDEGEVTVSLNSDGDDRVRIMVRDNGVGLPEGLDWKRADSLGLRLVQMLSGQIGAEVEVERSGGTKFEVSFRVAG